MLDKVGTINEKGEYVSEFKSNEQRFGVHLGPLSNGRSLATIAAVAQSATTLAIA